MTRMVQLKRIATTALIVFGLGSPLLEGISCKKGENMVPKPGLVQDIDAKVKQKGEDAIKKYGPRKAILAICEIADEIKSVKTGFDLMTEYKKKFGQEGLEEIKRQIFFIGLIPKDFTTVEKTDPKKFLVYKMLAYGIALYNETGLDAAIDIIRSSGKARSMVFSFGGNKDYSVPHGIATMAFYIMLNNNLFDKDKAVSRLGSEAFDEGLQIPEKQVFIGWIKAIKPTSLCGFDTPKDSETRDLIRLNLQGVPCPVKR